MERQKRVNDIGSWVHISSPLSKIIENCATKFEERTDGRMPDYSDAVCLEYGEAWLKRHHEHVLKLVAGEAQGVKPSGSDGRKPELWKSIYRRWFFDTRKA